MDKKPVIVYSSWLQNNYQGVLSQKDFAIYSNRLSQKAGYKTVLYTDQASKKLLGDIPFNKIVDFDEDILNQLPKTVWAAGKILAFSMQTGPFIHLDFDFFILNNNFYEQIKDKHFFLFHEEPWSGDFGFDRTFNKQGIQKILEITNNDFGANLDEKSISLNFSMFGSCKESAIPIIVEKSKLTIETLIKYKNQFEDDSFKKHFQKYFRTLSLAIPSMVVEQVILPNIISQALKSPHYPIIKLKNLKDLVKNFKEEGLLHLWGFKKNNKIIDLIKKHNDCANNVT